MVNIPNYLSQEDMGLMVSLEAETSFNTMMQSIGINELHNLEESGEVIVTEASIKELKDKFLSWLEFIWKKIKNLFEQALTWVKKQIDKVNTALSKLFQKNMSKAKESLKKRVAELKDKTSDSKKKSYGTAHTWDGFEEIVSGTGKCWEAVKVYDNIVSQLPAIVTNADSINKMKEKQENANSIGKDLELTMERKVKAALDVSELTSESIQKSVKKKIVGMERKDVGKDYLVKHFEEIWKYGTDFGETSNKVKKSLKETEKRFDVAKKDVEALARKLMVADSDHYLSQIISVMKKGKINLVAIDNAILACVRARCSEASGFVLRIAFSSKQKPVKESAMIPSSFQTELASLFEI